MTVTDIIEEVRQEMCNDYCKYHKECDKALEEGKDFPCPLGRL